MKSKYMHFVISALSIGVMAALAAPRAIGVGLMHYAENAGAAGQLGDGPPSDLKALHEASEKAFKAMQENIAKVQDVASKALEEVRQEGTLHKKTNETLTELGAAGVKMNETLAELKARQTELEQKVANKPIGDFRDALKSIGQIVAESEEFKVAMAKGAHAKSMEAVTVGSFHKTSSAPAGTIVNAPLNNDQPLVGAQRLPGIIMPGLRRMTVRDLLPQTRTTSNLIEFAKELVFTNNAGPQYDAGSPGPLTDGAQKPQSTITFELANTAVITLAHWIPASRQVLSDAPRLQGYIDGRLRYGLILEEEDQLLNGNGSAGALSGLVSNATAFTGGATNQTALDTLLKAQLQVSLSEYALSGYVLHPSDWTDILLLKDTTGRYLFSDPHGMEAPRVWGADVVPTQSQSIGQFLAGAFNLAAEIFDREDATVRVAEQHDDFFIRNLVAVLAEERLALAVYRAAALVKGAVRTAG